MPPSSATAVTTRRRPTPWSFRPSSSATAVTSSAPPRPTCTARSPRAAAWSATIRTARRIASCWSPPRTASACSATTAARFRRLGRRRRRGRGRRRGRRPCRRCRQLHRLPRSPHVRPPVPAALGEATTVRAPSRVVLTALLGSRPARAPPAAGDARRLDRLPATHARQRRLSRGAGPLRGGRQPLRRALLPLDRHLLQGEADPVLGRLCLPSALPAVPRRGHRPACRRSATTPRSCRRTSGGGTTASSTTSASTCCPSMRTICISSRGATSRSSPSALASRENSVATSRGRRLPLPQEAVLPARALQRRDADLGRRSAPACSGSASTASTSSSSRAATTSR